MRSQTTIPTEWKQVKLGEVIRLEYGKPLSDSKRKFDGAYPVYGANGEKMRTDEYYYDKKSIIVGRKGSVGELNLTSEKFWPLDVTYYVVFESKKCNLMFLYELLYTLNLPKLAAGVKPGLNRNEVYSIDVKIPSLPEQEKIVEVLGSWDSYLEKLSATIELKKKAKKGLIEKLLSGKIRFPEFSEQQKKVTLGEIAEINPKLLKEYNEYKEVGFIAMADVTNEAKLEKVHKKIYKEVAKGFTKFSNGDVLFAKITPCMENGKGCLVENTDYQLIFGSTEFHIIRAGDKVIAKFLHYKFNNLAFRKYAADFMTGTAGQKRVPKEFLENYSFMIPSIQEQSAIINILTTADREIETLEKKKTLIEQQKKFLLNNLITGRIRLPEFNKK